MAGVTVPIIPMAHQYLFTEPLEGVHPGLPQLRDPDNLVYFREEVGGLCMGGYERDPAPWSLDGIPADFNGRLLAPDWPRFEPIMEGAIRRVPAMADARVSRVINGPEAFTPGQRVHPRRERGPRVLRGRRLLAPTASPAPAGSAARWRAGSSRASPSSTSGRWTSAASGRPTGRSATRSRGPIENYATYYDIHYPNEERQAGRPLRTSPAYEALAALGAVFGEKSGWERPNWFEPNADDPRFGAGRPRALRPRGWAGEHWSPAIAAEALATRQAAALFDESLVRQARGDGPGALDAFLQRVAGNDIDRPVGTVVYTQLLDRRGGIQADLTVTRLGDRAVPARDRHGLRQPRRRLAAHAPARRRLASRSATSRPRGSASGLGAAGSRHPRRAHPRRLSSDAAFPYLTAREITVGDVPVLALRVTYVGELGWELYAPTEYGRALWDVALVGGAPARPGRRRLPGHRGAPAREGLPRVVERHHARRDARSRPASGSPWPSTRPSPCHRPRRAASPRRRPARRKRLRCLVLDDPRSVCLGNEPVRVDGAIVGRVTTGGYGFAVERSIAYAYLPPARAAFGTRGEVEVFGTGSASRSSASRCTTPRTRRIRA